MSGTPMQTRFGCYIGNIDRSVTIDMLRQVFCQCGTIIDCSLNGREGDPYRFGFIDFATEDDRSRAMKYNGFTLVGRKLKVGVSKGNVNKPEGFTTGNNVGGGYQRMGVNRNYNNNDAGVMMMGANGLSPQQQMEARLLLQFLQEGKMDPRQLSPAQQQLLIACLGHNSNNNAVVNSSNTQSGSSTPAPAPQPQVGAMGSSAMQPSLPQHTMHTSNMLGDAATFMPNPNAANGMVGAGLPMMGGGAPQGLHINIGSGMMNPMSGGYGMMAPRQPPQQWGDMPMNGPGMYPPKMCVPPHRQQQQMMVQPGRQQPYVVVGGTAAISVPGAADHNHSASVNPPPAAETLKLREKQREQFFEVVRKDAEKYERKLQEKKAHSAAGGDPQRSGDSSASDDEEDKKPTKKSRKESSK